MPPVNNTDLFSLRVRLLRPHHHHVHPPPGWSRGAERPHRLPGERRIKMLWIPLLLKRQAGSRLQAHAHQEGNHLHRLHIRLQQLFSPATCIFLKICFHHLFFSEMCFHWEDSSFPLMPFYSDCLTAARHRAMWTISTIFTKHFTKNLHERVSMGNKIQGFIFSISDILQWTDLYQTY